MKYPKVFVSRFYFADNFAVARMEIIARHHAVQGVGKVGTIS